MKVALLGAAGTGKSWLSHALSRHWPEHVFLDAPDLDTVLTWDRALLMGLDWPDTRFQSEAASQQASRRAEDAQLRVWLGEAGRTYGVVYGQGPQRLRAAMQLILPQDVPLHQSQGRWRGPCDSCADPDCEFRLFTGRARATSVPTAPSSWTVVDLPPG